MSLPSHIDVAIIGAGAAGLAAARTLEGAGLSSLVLEARERIGGRAHTVTVGDAIPFDLGCGWLHSADQNPFVPIADQLGFAIDRSTPPWRQRSYKDIFPQAEREAFFAALDAFFTRVHAAAQRGADSAASDWLEPGNRWNPMIDAVSTYINGCELDQVSVIDLDAYEDTGINWRLPRGYGALVTAYGASCNVALNCNVTRIDHAGAPIRIETSRGALSADKVIVCVPTDLIAAEAIRFHPALPDKVEAAAMLPLGADDKVMLALTGDTDLPADGNLRAAATRTAMGTYHLRPFGRNCIEGFFGGRYARDLEDAGDGAMAAAATAKTVSLLGSDFRSKLRPLAESHWSRDPFARGSYSHALPGHAGKRAVLAASVDGRIFFAGEATSPNFFTTAHGAQQSGVRAAREAMER